MGILFSLTTLGTVDHNRMNIVETDIKTDISVTNVFYCAYCGVINDIPHNEPLLVPCFQFGVSV